MLACPNVNNDEPLTAKPLTNPHLLVLAQIQEIHRDFRAWSGSS